MQEVNQNSDLVIAEMAEVWNPAVCVAALGIDEFIFRFVEGQSLLNEIKIGPERPTDAIHDVTGFTALGID